MRVARTRAELERALAELPGTRALVMTMGALHAGHLALVERAQQLADHVIVSIYVNPLQFAPHEDFASYPRDLAADLGKLAGVDVVFAPRDEEMYPRAPLVRLDPGPVANILEGATRPGHFAGVLQVVCKVLNLTRPQFAVFGHKDAQQFALVTSMVADLDLGVEIVGVPTAREESGLARSSRNAYLSPAERRSALALSRALRAGAAADGGPEGILAAARREIASEPGVRLDYLVLVDPATFVEPREGATSGLLVIAAWVGATRLIDNQMVEW